MTIIDAAKFISAIPQLEQEIKRFKFLKEESKDIRVAVFGKYNHGKSTLLNTIIGKEIFKISDKRETIKNQVHQHENIVWVDTPGLDADVTRKDDKEAREGAFTTADVLLLVHNLKAGELDKYEVQYYKSLMVQKKDFQKRMFLMLTQADQVTPEQQAQVVSVIKKQLPELTTFVVSATRYTKGLAENKSAFIERSGMPETFKLFSKLSTEIPSLRNAEVMSLKQKIQQALNSKHGVILKELHAAKDKVALDSTNFNVDVAKYTNLVQAKM